MKAGRVLGAASAPSTPALSRGFLARYVRGAGNRTRPNTGPQGDLKPPENAVERLARCGGWTPVEPNQQLRSLVLLDGVRARPVEAAPPPLLPEVPYLVLADVSSRLHRTSLRVRLSRWPALAVPRETREILGTSLDCLIQLAGRDAGTLHLAARRSGSNQAVILLKLRMSPEEAGCSGASPEPEPGLLDKCAELAEASGGRFCLSASFPVTVIRIFLPAKAAG